MISAETIVENFGCPAYFPLPGNSIVLGKGCSPLCITLMGLEIKFPLSLYPTTLSSVLLSWPLSLPISLSLTKLRGGFMTQIRIMRFFFLQDVVYEDLGLKGLQMCLEDVYCSSNMETTDVRKPDSLAFHPVYRQYSIPPPRGIALCPKLVNFISVA